MSSKVIKNWADDDKPREKLILKGRESLSDSELIAILLGSGTREMNALELARKLLSEVCNNDLTKLSRLSFKELKSVKGIGEAKAVTILAAMELGRRSREARSLRTTINSSKKAYEYLIPYLADYEVEKFYVIYLNNKMNVLGCEQIGTGGLTGTYVDPIIVFKKAFEYSANYLILAHNHPSGNLKPSEADRQVTRKLRDAGQLLNINVTDHIIVGHNEYFSFADNNEI